MIAKNDMFVLGINSLDVLVFGGNEWFLGIGLIIISIY